MAVPAPETRIATLDTIRGVAVLGILLLNIVAFGLVEAAYFNPRAQGLDGPLDLAVYLVNFVLFDGRMRGLFSLLFGASLLLIADRAAAKGEPAWRVHYARMAWLLAFGCAHLWLVWYGDILAHYALVGMVAFLFRRLSVPALIATGVGLVILHFVQMLGIAYWLAQLDSGRLVDPATLAEFRGAFGVPPPADIAREVSLHRGPYAALLAQRFADTASYPLVSLKQFGIETLAYMLFGMAALRTGMLTGGWDRARYRRWAIVGFTVGVPAYAALAWWMTTRGFTLTVVLTGALALPTLVRPIMIVGWAALIALLLHPGGALTTRLAWWMATRGFALSVVFTGALALPTLVRPVMIVGWAALIVLLLRPGGALTMRLAAAGRMAFSNYLLTSIICTTVFYGYGLGQFGAWSRAQLYLLVAAVWTAILLWSPWWLARYRFGPFEWAWRSLARGQWQPLRGPAA